MPTCNLIWYQDETYGQVVQRATKLAREYNQVVTILDRVSGKRVKIITPETGFFEVRRCSKV